MARLLSVTRCLAIFLALTIQHVAAVRTGGRVDLEVSSNQAPEAFTDDGGTLSVHEGDRLTLTCTATGTDPRRVFWFESTTLLPSSDRQDAKDKYSTTLVLDPIQAADDGRILACRLDSSTQHQKVTLKVQKILNRGFQLHISAKPAGALSSEEIVKVHLGSKLELTCSIQGLIPHRLSWWRGQEQIPTAAGEMGLHTATSSMILNPVGVADHLKALTCRADGSTISRTVTLEVQGIQDGMSQKATSKLEEILRDPTLQAICLTVALVCGLLLIIACVLTIKALQTYLKITKIHDQQVRGKQQGVSSSSSSSSRRGQAKTPAMKQSLKNQILASAGLLAPRHVAGAGLASAALLPPRHAAGAGLASSALLAPRHAAGAGLASAALLPPRHAVGAGLASAALLPQKNAAGAGTDNTDQRDTNESDPINQDGNKEGEDNPTFVEEV